MLGTLFFMTLDLCVWSTVNLFKKNVFKNVSLQHWKYTTSCFGNTVYITNSLQSHLSVKHSIAARPWKRGFCMNITLWGTLYVNWGLPVELCNILFINIQHTCSVLSSGHFHSTSDPKPLQESLFQTPQLQHLYVSHKESQMYQNVCTRPLITATN